MGERSDRNRIVEWATAASLAAVSGAVAFLAVPLDLAGGTGSPTAPPAAEARAIEARPRPPPPASAPPSPAPRRVAPADPFEMLLPPPRAWRYHPPEGLRLSAIAHCDRCAGDSARCATSDRVQAAIVERTALLDDPDDGRALDLLFLLGAGYQAVGDWERAAEYYEAFALHGPSEDGAGCTDEERATGTCADAPAALENAILFRRALGQVDRALDDAELYERFYSETRVADSARVSAQAGEMLAAQGGHVEAASHLGRHTERYARHVPPGAALRMQVRLGRARLEAGDRPAAARLFRRAVRRWQRGLGERIASSPDEDPSASGAEFSRTLEAVSEAAFRLAELRFDAFRAVERPSYEGDGSLGDVERWVATRLRPWVLRKVRALRDARDAYERVAALGVTEWQIAARARTGEAFRMMMEDLAAAPVPEVVASSDEQIAAVAVEADAWREPAMAELRGPAVEAFERCLLTAVRTRHFGAWSRRCADQLTRLDPGAHPPDVELLPGGLRIHDPPVLPVPSPVLGTLPEEGCSS